MRGRKKTRRKWMRFFVGTVLVSTAALPASADEAEALNRSFYVPVQWNLCEHLESAVLYRDETPLRALPGTHVFQFTFYPKLKRLEPAWERVRVVGRHQDVTFRTEAVVTPASVYMGKKKIELDLDEQMKKLRHRIDARHETVELTLRCSRACGRRVAASRKPSSSR